MFRLLPWMLYNLCISTDAVIPCQIQLCEISYNLNTVVWNSLQTMVAIVLDWKLHQAKARCSEFSGRYSYVDYRYLAQSFT